MLVGIFLTVIMFFGSRLLSGAIFVLVLGPVLFLAGMGLVAYAVFSGLSFTNTLRTKSAPTPLDGVRIQARYAMNTIGEMLFNEQDWDLPGTRFYVRILYPNGRSSELECAYPVFCQCGEGMWGTAIIQGDWVSQFTPSIVRT